jgi:prolyl oligopeptidase
MHLPSTLAFCLPLALLAAFASRKPAYPPTRTVEHVDAYHGARVADPYRWMEQLDSPEARSAWRSRAARTAGC